MTRKECLEQAMGCVLQDRASQYGTPEDNFGRIAKLWSIYTGTVLDGIDVAMMMALLKVARIRNNKDYSDGYIDLAGYAACGAELAGRAEAYRQSIEAAGEEYKKLRAEAEAKDFEEQAKTRENPPEEPEGNHPENPDSSPKFKPGDRVQVRMSAADGDRWEDAVCVSILPEGTGIRVDYGDYKAIAFGWPNIRHAPKAEGCEEPAYNPDNDVVGGVVTLAWPRGKVLEKLYASGRVEKCAEGCEALVEKDAPQTKEELFNRIVDCNPSTFGCVHKPTGEELAEMAEEEPHE